MFNMQAFYNDLVGVSQVAAVVKVNEPTAVSKSLSIQQLFQLTHLTRQDLNNAHSNGGWRSWVQVEEEVS